MKQRQMDTSPEIPQGIRIFPDETLLEAPTVEINLPDRHLSAIEAMINLTGVHRSKDIGTNGSSNAAYTRPQDRNNKFLDKFNHKFHRDDHVIAEFLLPYHPLLTHEAIKLSLEYMGTIDNYDNPMDGPFDEQEKGKIAHEILSPDHPTAIELRERKNWGFPYYGATDTTGKNILAIHRLVNHPDYGVDYLKERYIGRDKIPHTILYGLDQNIAWITGRMNRNPEGLVENLDRNPLHHANQTWADSPESFHHKDGSWAQYQNELGYGVAAVELQAETYDALLGGADIYEKIGRFKDAAALRERAARLRAVILKEFWVDDSKHFGGYFARGTDRDSTGRLRTLEIRSSDMGHLLQSGILDPVEDADLNTEITFKREAVIRNLFSDEMLCPSGIRTLSADSARYGDARYHNGSSWPWTTYFIARGLDKHGYHGLSYELKKRVWENYNQTHVLGEYASGSSDPDDRIVSQAVLVRNDTLTSEQTYHISRPAQLIQGWTAAAIYAMKHEYAAVTACRLGGRYLAAVGVSSFRMAALTDDRRTFESEILLPIREQQSIRYAA